MNREERRRQKKLGHNKSVVVSPEAAKAAHTHLEQAKGLFEKGEYDEADELCQDASASMPLDAEPFHLRALIQYRLGNLSLAGNMILEAITRNDEDPEIHANCGTIMNMLGRHAEAEAACRYVISLRPRRADAYGNLAVALEMQGRFDEAIEASLQALKLQPDYPEARINLGNLLVRKGDLIGAVEAYAMVIEAAPESPTACANMSVALLQLGELEAAETFARQALDINPDYPEALIALGNALSAQALYSNALQAFEKALALLPLSIEATTCRASVLLACGQLDEAEAACRELIVDGEGAAEIFVGLGRALLAKGQLDDAVSSFRSALEIKPALADAHCKLAFALGAAMTDAELDALQKITVAPKTYVSDRVALQFALAGILDSRGDGDKAFAAYGAGNTLRESLLNINEIEFDPNEYDDHIETLTKVFSDSQKTSATSRGSDTDAPVFVVGMPNSGITHIEQILSAHPKVVSLGDAATVLDLVGDEPENYLDDIGVFEALVETAGLKFTCTEAVERVVDTTPLHFLYLGVIERLFPNARIIHCLRDPMETGLACYFQDFRMDHSWSTNISHIKRFMDGEVRIMKHWKQKVQLPVLTMTYEMLATDPDTAQQQLFDFLDLDVPSGNSVVQGTMGVEKDYRRYTDRWADKD